MEGARDLSLTQPKVMLLPGANLSKGKVERILGQRLSRRVADRGVSSCGGLSGSKIRVLLRHHPRSDLVFQHPCGARSQDSVWPQRFRAGDPEFTIIFDFANER
jgi:hypothetical protein